MRTLAALVAIVIPLAAAADDRAVRAYRRIDAADALVRSGRLGAAWAGYLEVLREFPTWWLPTARAAATARALGLSRETSAGYAARAMTLSPDGTYARLVRDLIAVEDEGTLPDPAGYPAGDPNLDRIALVRARAMAASGRHEDAAREYRSILARRPGCPAATWGLARELDALGRTDEAEALRREGAGTSLLPQRWRAGGRAPARDTNVGSQAQIPIDAPPRP